MIGLDKISVVFKNQFDLSVGQGAHFDVLLDPLRNGGFAQPGQILDDVVGLKANGDGRIEGVGGQLIFMDEFWTETSPVTNTVAFFLQSSVQVELVILSRH